MYIQHHFLYSEKKIETHSYIQRSVTRPTLTQYTLAVALNLAARKQTEWLCMAPFSTTVRIRAGARGTHIAAYKPLGLRAGASDSKVQNARDGSEYHLGGVSGANLTHLLRLLFYPLHSTLAITEVQNRVAFCPV